MQNDEQPTAAAFARMQEQLTGMAADIREIKQDVKDGRASQDGRLDAVVRSLAEERQQRVENDNMLRLEIQKSVQELLSGRQKLLDEVRSRQEATERATEVLAWQFKWVGGVLVVASGLIQWAIGIGLRMMGR